jgi:hypothetical protein
VGCYNMSAELIHGLTAAYSCCPANPDFISLALLQSVKQVPGRMAVLERLGGEFGFNVRSQGPMLW